MSKLYFKYGTMNSGKNKTLLQIAKNYEDKNLKVKIIKPIINNKNYKGNERIDYIVKNEDNLKEFLKNSYYDKISILLVDDAHFLNREQVDELYLFTKKFNIPVICFGLRTDFKTSTFEGSLRLFELADEMEEIITICKCGRKAKINARIINGKYVTTGEQVLIEDKEFTNYETLCGKCYLEKVLNIDLNKLD